MKHHRDGSLLCSFGTWFYMVSNWQNVVKAFLKGFFEGSKMGEVGYKWKGTAAPVVIE